MNLPLILRGEGYYRKLEPGIHIPCWAIDAVRAIDPHLFFIWHPYQVLYDDLINNYSGSIEDPRFTIRRQEQYGSDLIFGFVLTDGKGKPKIDEHWHLWRLCDNHGWAHILKLQSTDYEYLRIFVDRLFLQAQVTNKYGTKGWNRFLRTEQVVEQEMKEKQAMNVFQDRSDENRWLMKKAYENFQNGIISATKPTKDIITSFPGQTNRSRIIRPLTDDEGGIV